MAENTTANLQSALVKASSEQLKAWLLANKTGNARLRARLPAGWRVGDKTGSGERGSTNDVGILWPPNSAPIVVAAYLTETAAPADWRNETPADLARRWRRFSELAGEGMGASVSRLQMWNFCTAAELLSQSLNVRKP